MFGELITYYFKGKSLKMTGWGLESKSFKNNFLDLIVGTFGTGFPYCAIFSYGIKNRDEVTFMKKLRKKWEAAPKKCFYELRCCDLMYLWFFLFLFIIFFQLKVLKHMTVLYCVRLFYFQV